VECGVDQKEVIELVIKSAKGRAGGSWQKIFEERVW
jgi:hypothetical protein